MLSMFSLNKGLNNPSDAIGQHFAADYTQKMTSRPVRELVDKAYMELAQERGIDTRAIDSYEDIGRYGERKTLEDAAKAVRAIKTYFAGEPLPEQSALAPTEGAIPETEGEAPKAVLRKRAGEGGFAVLREGAPKAGPALEDARRAVRLEPPSTSKRVVAGIKSIPERVQTALTSEFTPLRKLEAAVRSDKPVVDIARKFEQVAGAPAKAEADFIDFKKAVVDPLRQDADDFNSYLFLKRVEDRLTRDPETKRVADWTVEKARQGLDELKTAVGPETMKEFERTGKVYQDEMKKALKLQVDSGRMSQELYDKIVSSNDFYAPFKVLKYIEEGEGMAGAGRRIATTQQLTKKITGIDSTDFQVGNILQASAEQIMRSRVLAEKNLKMQDLAKLADTPNELIKKVETDVHPRPGFEIVRYYENGKPQGLEVSHDVETRSGMC